MFQNTIISVPKQSAVTCLNDYRPVALTPLPAKCLERLVKKLITSIIPASFDPYQFAYRQNRSTEDAIAIVLHTALQHLEKQNTYVRMLFIDYSSAFNTILPCTLIRKLQTLGLSNSLRNWVLSFLTDRTQAVRLGDYSSPTLSLSTSRCLRRSKCIIMDQPHPAHHLFQLLPSGRRYRSLRAGSARFLNSFFPQAIRLLNNK